MAQLARRRVQHDRVGVDAPRPDLPVEVPGGIGCPPSGVDAVDGAYKWPDVSL